MEIFYYKDGFNYVNDKPINLCLGFFDGLHIGHKFLINKAKQLNENVGVLTFVGALKNLTNKRDTKALLTSLEDRKEILQNMGVKYLFVAEFNLDIMNMSKDDFLDKMIKPLNIDTLVVGNDYTFGSKASGNVDYLRTKFKVEVVDFVLEDGKKVSTSEIINYIKEGKILKANELLGRYYSIKGVVEHGLSNGTRLGFKTANIKPKDNKKKKKKGVYATYVKIEGKTYLSMTNIGNHPTIDRLDYESIEANIFDFEEDIYQKEVEVYFLEFMRDEKKFDSVNDLIAQLNHDRDYVVAKYKKRVEKSQHE